MEEGAAARIARLRKLTGWTQEQLAMRAFVSTSLVKKVEQQRTPPSPAFVASCARALGVDIGVLYSTQDNDARGRLVERAGIDKLRAALHAFDDPEPQDPPLSLAELQRQLVRAQRWVYSFRYEELGQLLPQLLHRCYEACGTTALGTREGEQARALLHDAYRLAATLSGRFGQPDLAAVASERHFGLAPETGDPLRVAISAYHRSTHSLQHGHFGRGLRMLERAQETVRSSTAAARHSVSIQLHLRSAVLAARAGDTARADEHITAARAISDEHAPRPFPYYNIDASRLNIDIHWCAVPVENYDGTTSVSRAARITLDTEQQPERRGHHHIDMARAWLLHGNRDRAIAELNAARRISPDHTRRHPTVYETVRALAQADRRTTGSLASFARWAGIQL